MSPPTATADLLSPLRGARLSLAELEAELARLLDLLAPAEAGADGRVSARPDARTLRFYQSRGLIDRPLDYAGRQAIYGYVHVIQALCIKLLQAGGLRLDQVQARLAGAPFSLLEGAVHEAFAGVRPPVGLPEAPPGPAPREGPAPEPPPRALLAVELAPGLQLTIDPALVPDPELVISRVRAALGAGGVR